MRRSPVFLHDLRRRARRELLIAKALVDAGNLFLDLVDFLGEAGLLSIQVNHVAEWESAIVASSTIACTAPLAGRCAIGRDGFQAC